MGDTLPLVDYELAITPSLALDGTLGFRVRTTAVNSGGYQDDLGVYDPEGLKTFLHELHETPVLEQTWFDAVDNGERFSITCKPEEWLRLRAWAGRLRLVDPVSIN